MNTNLSASERLVAALKEANASPNGQAGSVPAGNFDPTGKLGKEVPKTTVKVFDNKGNVIDKEVSFNFRIVI